MVASIEVSRIGLVAAVLIALTGEPYQATFVAGSALAFVLGFFISTRRFKKFNSESLVFPIPLTIYRPIVGIALVISVGCMVHYSIIGLPAFSEDVNASRFSSADSGLLGIPSRVATYGPSMLATIGFIILIWNKSISQPKKLVRLAWILVLIAAVTTFLRGHKASLLGLLFIFLVISRFLPRRSLKKSIVNVALIGVALIFLAGVQAVFTKGSGTASESIYDYLYDRIALSGPDALQMAVKSEFNHLQFSSSSAFIGEILYPFNRLLGIDDKLYVLELSHVLYGVPADDFSVPVTPSVIAPVVHDFGLVWAPLVLLAIGLGLGRITVKIRKSFSSVFIWLSLEILLYQGIGRGAPFYILLNGLVLLIPVWLMLKIRVVPKRNFVLKRGVV
ncbi:O-antigen polymerase [Pseudacidovorax sp. NFM-22]|uniref:O-antigen polymerase n=1 Tax=Pseudacidovorax sp. NFM-22 TaxID=2744469 RepID=UPI001F191EFF|nr:O-antigen polymerase [Pseudacidovorax sp. NFM-22]